jgi:hypothetical protein
VKPRRTRQPLPLRQNGGGGGRAADWLQLRDELALQGEALAVGGPWGACLSSGAASTTRASDDSLLSRQVSPIVRTCTTLPLSQRLSRGAKWVGGTGGAPRADLLLFGVWRPLLLLLLLLLPPRLLLVLILLHGVLSCVLDRVPWRGRPLRPGLEGLMPLSRCRFASQHQPQSCC